MRLGGADGVRGFSEGSETGEIGARFNIETYSPAFETGGAKIRGLVFVDGGGVKSKSGNDASVSSAGFGMRSAITENASMRLDAGYIIRAGNDPQQLKGDWRIHAALTATF
jgi:hemolysin activation/secretion protein